MLENRRYETLQLTFKQVAKNFHDVFKKLIAQGRADLIMKTADAGSEVSAFFDIRYFNSLSIVYALYIIAFI